MRRRSGKNGQGMAKESLRRPASAIVMRVFSGEVCRSDSACGDENPSTRKDVGGAGVGVDRMEGYDQTVCEDPRPSIPGRIGGCKAELLKSGPPSETH